MFHNFEKSKFSNANTLVIHYRYRQHNRRWNSGISYIDLQFKGKRVMERGKALMKVLRDEIRKINPNQDRVKFKFRGTQWYIIASESNEKWKPYHLKYYHNNMEVVNSEGEMVLYLDGEFWIESRPSPLVPYSPPATKTPPAATRPPAAKTPRHAEKTPPPGSPTPPIATAAYPLPVDKIPPPGYRSPPPATTVPKKKYKRNRAAKARAKFYAEEKLKLITVTAK